MSAQLGHCHSSALALFALVLLAGCQQNSYQVEMMTTPDLFASGKIQPFENSPVDGKEPLKIHYATDRLPSDNPVSSPFYKNERGHSLQLGIAEVVLARDDVRNASLLKADSGRFPQQIKAVHNMGLLGSAVDTVKPPEVSEQQMQQTAKAYAASINAQLARSPKKDIYIYVHGYRVIFDNPILVAAELWYFLGYRGAFIAYAWPSTPSRFAYASDLETAAYSSHHLRLFLEYLAADTDAENIHLLGYSAGTRVVLASLHQLAMFNHNKSDRHIRETYRLGETILVSSDYDRDLFSVGVSDGLLRMQQRLNLYISPDDKALGASQWLFGRRRLGQALRDEQVDPERLDRLSGGTFHVIDVEGAEGSRAGNGHAYFRRSPWVSSDILLSLYFGMAPENRGLYRPQGQGFWRFPDNYTEESLVKVKQWIKSRYNAPIDAPSAMEMP